MAARHYKICYENKISYIKRLSNDNVKVERGAVMREIQPGVGFKIGYFVQEELGRAHEND